MSFNKLLTEVKKKSEDFEWYPTTEKMIVVLRDDIMGVMSTEWDNPSVEIMDVGAGNGKVLSTLKKMEEEDCKKGEKTGKRVKTLQISKMFAIEKSKTLIDAMPNEIFLIGSEFFEQTFVDKKMDVYFSNPPYSIWDTWCEKLIKEANANYLYLIIPDRWENNERVTTAIEKRKAEVEIVGKFSFEDSEDRKARANVHLLRIELGKKERYGDGKLKVDPFELWFNETYNFKEKDTTEKKESRKEKIHGNMVKGSNLIERIEELYLRDMAHLHKNYLSIAELDPELLEQIGASKESMMEAMKLKIEGLKHVYWEELFDNLDTITSRLTSKSRKEMLETLRGNTSVDFTVKNAYAIVIWAIKNANAYYDSQLLALYGDLTRVENIIKYKSNQRVIHDDWRFLKEEMTHYALDYRIVMHYYEAIRTWGRGTELSDNVQIQINDMITIANNLGFKVSGDSRPESSVMQWDSGQKNNFYFSVPKNRELRKGTKTNHGKIEEVYYQEEDGYYQYRFGDMWIHGSSVRIPEDIFVEIKAFKNGNIHCKFNKKFMKALNIEAARLNKWIKSPKEASEEFDITEEEAKSLFGTNFAISSANLTNLLPHHQ